MPPPSPLCFFSSRLLMLCRSAELFSICGLISSYLRSTIDIGVQLKDVMSTSTSLIVSFNLIGKKEMATMDIISMIESARKQQTYVMSATSLFCLLSTRGQTHTHTAPLVRLSDKTDRPSFFSPSFQAAFICLLVLLFLLFLFSLLFDKKPREIRSPPLSISRWSMCSTRRRHQRRRRQKISSS